MMLLLALFRPFHAGFRRVPVLGSSVRFSEGTGALRTLYEGPCAFCGRERESATDDLAAALLRRALRAERRTRRRRAPVRTRSVALPLLPCERCGH